MADINKDRKSNIIFSKYSNCFIGSPQNVIFKMIQLKCTNPNRVIYFKTHWCHKEVLIPTKVGTFGFQLQHSPRLA